MNDSRTMTRDVLFGAVMALVVCVIAGGALWFMTHRYVHNLDQARQAQTLALHAARDNLVQLKQDLQHIREHQAKFLALRQSRLYGKESRLQWYAALEEIGAALQIPELKYQVNAQHSLPGDRLGNMELRGSEMILRLGMIHEGDLFRLLDQLEDRTQSVFSVEHCQIKRGADDIDFSELKSNLNAECSLRWYTVAEQPATRQAMVTP